MNRRSLIALLAASAALGGCSTFKKLTGKSNDTVLPGQREDILTPDQYTAKSEDLNPPADGSAPPPAPAPAPAQQQTTQPAAQCDPTIDPDCVPPPKKAVNKGIFNDG